MITQNRALGLIILRTSDEALYTLAVSKVIVHGLHTHDMLVNKVPDKGLLAFINRPSHEQFIRSIEEMLGMTKDFNQKDLNKGNSDWLII